VSSRRRFFAEICRVLRPGGLLLFSTLGPQTLEELRSAWRAVDTTPHVSEFVDLPQLSVAMGGAGLAEPVLDTDQVVRHYPDPLALMRELKGLGPAMPPAIGVAGSWDVPRCARSRQPTRGSARWTVSRPPSR